MLLLSVAPHGQVNSHSFSFAPCPRIQSKSSSRGQLQELNLCRTCHGAPVIQSLGNVRPIWQSASDRSDLDLLEFSPASQFWWTMTGSMASMTGVYYRASGNSVLGSTGNRELSKRQARTKQQEACPLPPRWRPQKRKQVFCRPFAVRKRTSLDESRQIHLITTDLPWP